MVIFFIPFDVLVLFRNRIFELLSIYTLLKSYFYQIFITLSFWVQRQIEGRTKLVRPMFFYLIERIV